MKQEEKAESRQKVTEHRIKMLEEAGYTKDWKAGIAAISEVIDACYLVACDMVFDTDITDPKTANGYILTYTQMLFSRMQIAAPQPSREGVALMQGMRMPHLHPNQN